MDTIYTTRADIEGIANLDPTYDDCEIVEWRFWRVKNEFESTIESR